MRETTEQRHLIELANAIRFCYRKYNHTEMMPHQVRGLNMSLKFPEETQYKILFDKFDKGITIYNDLVKIVFVVEHAKGIEPEKTTVTIEYLQPLWQAIISQ